MIALLVVLLPIVEIWLLVQIGQHIGFWPTIGMLLATAVIGAQLAKAEGMRVLRQVQAALAEGKPPERELMSGFLVFVGGLLLILPGVISDAIGVLLLLPPTRAVVARLLRRRWDRAVRAGRVVVVDPRRPERPDLDDVIDVEAEPVERDPRQLPDKTDKKE